MQAELISLCLETKHSYLERKPTQTCSRNKNFDFAKSLEIKNIKEPKIWIKQ